MNDLSAHLIHPPKQKRSRALQQRIVAAGLHLLRDHALEDLTMAQIAREVNCSVGNVYKRFTNKEALLVVLIDAVRQELVVDFAATLKANVGKQQTLRSAVTLVVAYLRDFFHRHRNLVSALMTHSGDGPAFGDTRDRMAQQAFAVLAPMMPPDIDLRARSKKFSFAWHVAVGFFLEMAVNEAGPRQIDDPDLVDDMTQMIVAYLEIPDS
jgi:AcrR family transcriptional regulator